MIPEKFSWRNFPLGTKLALLASLLVVVVVSALMSLAVQRERASYRQELAAQAQLFLATLPLTLRDQIYGQVIDELAEIAKVMKANETVTRFVIYDKNGVVLMDAETLEPTYAHVADPLGLVILTSADGEYQEWQNDQFIAGHAISVSGQHALVKS